MGPGLPGATRRSLIGVRLPATVTVAVAAAVVALVAAIDTRDVVLALTCLEIRKCGEHSNEGPRSAVSSRRRFATPGRRRRPDRRGAGQVAR